jgi:predicted nucleic acid-binding OB-fold protein
MGTMLNSNVHSPKGATENASMQASQVRLDDLTTTAQETLPRVVSFGFNKEPCDKP